MLNWIHIIKWFFKYTLMSDTNKTLEILALRSQLAITQQYILNNKTPKPRCNNVFRQLWVLLSKCLPNWKTALVIVQPDTVVHWHKTAFKKYWQRKSQGGRPRISAKTIALIRQIHNENPLLSPEKIHERLVNLSVKDAPSPNTIAKYIKLTHIQPTGKQIQSWHTFLRNHRKNIWAMDFAVVPTLTFKPLYILLIINHARRKIEHFAVTANPNTEWLKQQIRNATSFGKQPKYLVHDNDAAFVSQKFQQFLTDCRITSKRTSFRSPWQNGICERLVGIMRRELLDHIIPLNEKHLERLLIEYVDYYNNVRTHQTLDGETPVPYDRPPKTNVTNTVLKSIPILGGLYHDYKKVA